MSGNASSFLKVKASLCGVRADLRPTGPQKPSLPPQIHFPWRILLIPASLSITTRVRTRAPPHEQMLRPTLDTLFSTAPGRLGLLNKTAPETWGNGRGLNAQNDSAAGSHSHCPQRAPQDTRAGPPSPGILLPKLRPTGAAARLP